MAEPCSDCARVRDGPGWPMFNPACLHCGARLIGRIRNLPRPGAEIKARQSKVLEDWQALGHDRAEMLRLSRTECPVCPLPPSGSESPTPAKPRSAKPKSRSASPDNSSQSSIDP